MIFNQANEPLVIEGPNAKREYRAQMADGTWTQPHLPGWWRGDSELHKAVRRFIVKQTPSLNKALTVTVDSKVMQS